MPQSLVSWGILEEIADTDTAAIDKDDIIYAVTDNFGYFKSDFLDAVLGGPEGLSKKTDAFAKAWIKEDSPSGDMHADLEVSIFIDIILRFEAMKEYFNDEDERLGPPKKGEQRPMPTVTFKDNYELNPGNQSLLLDYHGSNHEAANVFI
jgi:hypothetical protein